jgi:hypothetical protein
LVKEIKYLITFTENGDNHCEKQELDVLAVSTFSLHISYRHRLPSMCLGRGTANDENPAIIILYY